MKLTSEKLAELKNSLIIELTALANSASIYERKSCSYKENLSEVSKVMLSILYKEHKVSTDNPRTLSSFINWMLKGKLEPRSCAVIV